MEKPQFIVRQPGEGPTISVAGDLYRFLVQGEHTGGRFALWHATVPAGGGPPPHLHRRECEGFYVLRGEVTFYVEDQSFKAGPGTFVHLPEDRPHRFANESAEDAEMLLLCAPAGFEKMFFEVGTPSQSALPMEPSDIPRLLEAAPRYGVEILVETPPEL